MHTRSIIYIYTVCRTLGNQKSSLAPRMIMTSATWQPRSRCREGVGVDTRMGQKTQTMAVLLEQMSLNHVKTINLAYFQTNQYGEMSRTTRTRGVSRATAISMGPFLYLLLEKLMHHLIPSFGTTYPKQTLVNPVNPSKW